MQQRPRYKGKKGKGKKGKGKNFFLTEKSNVNSIYGHIGKYYSINLYMDKNKYIKKYKNIDILDILN